MEPTGTIFDIKRFAIHDGPGIRTTVFFKGCPLDCIWCHNPESRSPDPEPVAVRRVSGIGANDAETKGNIGCVLSVDTVMREVLADEIFFDQSGGGATFSGGEPMMQIDFLDALLRASRDTGIHTAVDTCGYAPFEDFERIIAQTDLFLYDLKLMDAGLHEKYTGSPNTRILDNLTLLAESAASVIIRIPLIPDISATEENMTAVADFLDQHPSLNRIDLLPCNKLGEDKIRRYNLNRSWGITGEVSDEDVAAIRYQFESRGYDVRIEG